MPFTFLHPAIVFPLKWLLKKRVSLTGLVIGSLTPDFEYFLRMRLQSDYSHTLSGLFLFNIPMGILLTFIFHNGIRNSLVENLPTILKSRLSVFKCFDWTGNFKTHRLIIIISIFIGAASHLFWDSFTHPTGYFVNRIPGLKNSLTFFREQFLIMKIAQHASTLLGLIIILFVLWKLPKDKAIRGYFNIKYWGAFIVVTLSIMIIRLFNGLESVGNLIVIGISASIVSLLVTSKIVQAKK